MSKQVVYVDMDGVLVDCDDTFNAVDEKARQEYSGREDEIPGIFLNMPPMKGAIEAFDLLALQYDVYILSTAPWGNPSAWSDKLLWVKRHLGEAGHKRLILTHHKHLNMGDYLIDDRFANGAERFEGEHIHFGSERYPDWKAVLAYLL